MCDCLYYLMLKILYRKFDILALTIALFISTTKALAILKDSLRLYDILTYHTLPMASHSYKHHRDKGEAISLPVIEFYSE